MARKTAKTAQEILMADFQTLVSDTEKLLDDTAILAGDQADELRSKIHDSLLKARETLQLTETRCANAVRRRSRPLRIMFRPTHGSPSALQPA
jgi:Uncharacterized conserved protein